MYIERQKRIAVTNAIINPVIQNPRVTEPAVKFIPENITKCFPILKVVELQ